MSNEDYFEYIKNRPFREQLREFGLSCERYESECFQSADGPDRQYHANEAKGHLDRLNFLFELLNEEYEKKGCDNNEEG